jgi:hypothetical protein
MLTDQPVPRALSEPDTRAIIWMLGALEGELLADEIDVQLAQRLLGSFIRAGLLAPEAELAHLRRALAELGQRVRYARGEYDQPPGTEGPVTYQVVLASDGGAAKFRAAAASLWAGVRLVEPTPEDLYRRVVYVQDDALPLTAEFKEHQVAIDALAHRLGGTYRGYGM